MSGPPATPCGAKNRQGAPCGRGAGWGTDHPGFGRCKNHGGSSPSGEMHGGLIAARQQAAIFGIPIPVEPHDAILSCIAYANGEILFYDEQIAKLELDDITVAEVLTHERPRKFFGGSEAPESDEDTVPDEHAQSERVTEVKRSNERKLNIWIAARHQAMDRLVNYSAIAIKNGIEERRVKIAESQAALMARAIRGILDDLGVSDDPRAPAIVGNHLRLVAGGSE